jgi:hypothetical protein
VRIVPAVENRQDLKKRLPVWHIGYEIVVDGDETQRPLREVGPAMPLVGQRHEGGDDSVADL